MLSMKEQLQQVKQQMTTSDKKTENSAQKLEKMTAPKKSGEKPRPPAQQDKKPEKVTPWQQAQNAKKSEAAKTGASPEKSKNRQKKANRKKLEKLVSFWPELFSLDNPRPMIIGIDAVIKADIDARQLPAKGTILFTLGRYATHRKYLQALVAGGQRYDLNGNPAGEVTPEEQKQAAERLEAMKAHTGDAKP